ncbi:MAG TPA: ABC-type transport auxiliary lipoprotein family protein [Polyangiaceae bacterium]|nr:ABC-type transport auxiliary lipoprotein family protein [Polyangiaceae bacterium]
MTWAGAAATVLATVLSGCALTSRAAPLDVRYFSPLEVEPARMPRPIPQSAVALRIGHVTSSAYLRSRIVHRDSDFEVSEYETLRWTESPEVYVARSLRRALFDDRGLREALGGSPPTLDVEVTAFEESRRGPHRGGRVQLRYEIHDDQFVLASGTVAKEHDATDGSIEQVVAAIAVAMHAASSELATTVAETVERLAR